MIALMTTGTVITVCLIGGGLGEGKWLLQISKFVCLTDRFSKRFCHVCEAKPRAIGYFIRVGSLFLRLFKMLIIFQFFFFLSHQKFVQICFRSISCTYGEGESIAFFFLFSLVFCKCDRMVSVLSLQSVFFFADHCLNARNFSLNSLVSTVK